MKNTGIRKEKVSLTEVSEGMANKMRFNFLISLVEKTLMSGYPVNIVRYPRRFVLTIVNGYLYIDILGEVPGLKTDSWKIFPYLNDKKNLSLIKQKVSELIMVEEVKNLLDEIIINREDCYYREPWVGYHVRKGQIFTHKMA